MWTRAEKMQNRGETKVEPGGKKLGVWPNVMWKWTENVKSNRKNGASVRKEMRKHSEKMRNLAEKLMNRAEKQMNRAEMMWKRVEQNVEIGR